MKKDTIKFIVIYTDHKHLNILTSFYRGFNYLSDEIFTTMHQVSVS